MRIPAIAAEPLGGTQSRGQGSNPLVRVSSHTLRASKETGHLARQRHGRRGITGFSTKLWSRSVCAGRQPWLHNNEEDSENCFYVSGITQRATIVREAAYLHPFGNDDGGSGGWKAVHGGQ